MLRIEPGVIAHDQAFALQAAHAFGAGCGREADAFAQLGEGNATFLLQDAEDVAVDLVQLALALMLGTHGWRLPVWLGKSGNFPPI